VNGVWPSKISTPHVDLGVSISAGLKILESTGGSVFEEADGRERTYRVNLPNYEMAVYDTDGIVSSVWYNDPAGRLTPFGRERKIKLYMARYTRRGQWDLRMENGWMKYYFNDTDAVQIVYGIHMDVIRINGARNDDTPAA
jgi:hypothetical protein